MYQSANYVLFVNYEDFEHALVEHFKQHQTQTSFYFSGYDCDSLAFEPVSEFVSHFLPVFTRYPNAFLELRTKSTQIRTLQSGQVLENVVAAFSFTPEETAQRWEHKVPSVDKRIDAMVKLAQRGWKIGLRFDPLIYQRDFAKAYTHLFESIFSRIEPHRVHSVSLGLFRLPESFYKNMWRLYPDEPLFAAGLTASRHAGESGKLVSYSQAIEAELFGQCKSILLNYIDRNQYFPCQ